MTSPTPPSPPPGIPLTPTVVACCFACHKMVPTDRPAIFEYGKGIRHEKCP